MALSAEKKQRIIELLASGQTLDTVAFSTGCSRSSVKRVKNEPKNEPILEIARRALGAKTIDEQGSMIVATIQTLTEREPLVQETLWTMFEGLSSLFNATIAQTSAEDISARQLPALAKAACDVASAYADFSDRIHGLHILADEVEKINDSRTA